MFGVSMEVLAENILCQSIEVQTHIGMPRGAKFKFKLHLRACNTSGKKSLVLCAKKPIENHRGPISDKKSHGVKT